MTRLRIHPDCGTTPPASTSRIRSSRSKPGEPRSATGALVRVRSISRLPCASRRLSLPAVLDALAPYDAPELALVKGDAYRLVGHERDARLAFAEAAASIPAPATTQSRKERS